MADVGDVRPLSPIWPTRPVDKVNDSTEREKRRAPREEPSDTPSDDQQSDGTHVDEYA
jgi:hypothetical protein